MPKAIQKYGLPVFCLFFLFFCSTLYSLFVIICMFLGNLGNNFGKKGTFGLSCMETCETCEEFFAKASAALNDFPAKFFASNCVSNLGIRNAFISSDAEIVSLSCFTSVTLVWMPFFESSLSDEILSFKTDSAYELISLLV